MDSGPETPVTLVEAAHEHGVAVACRDDDGAELWLTADLAAGEWVELEDYGVSTAEVASVLALAGRTPSNVETAEVRDISGALHEAHVGEGAWLLVLPRRAGLELATVRFRDRSGAAVALPQPSGATAAPISDVTTACPACETTAWDLVGRSQSLPEQVIVCRSCGFGPLYYFGPEPPVPEVPDKMKEPLRRAGRVGGALAKFALGKWSDHALGQLEFPVYGLGPAWTGARSVASFSTDGFRRTFAVELLHGDPDDPGGPAVIVETMQETDERLSPELLAENMLGTGLETLLPKPNPNRLPDTLSGPARQLALQMETRVREAEIALRLRRASKHPVPIRVDDELVDFLLLESDGLWAAGAARGDLDVSIFGRGVKPPDVVSPKRRGRSGSA